MLGVLSSLRFPNRRKPCQKEASTSSEAVDPKQEGCIQPASKTKPALGHPLRPVPSILPLAMTTVMKERVGGGRALDRDLVGWLAATDQDAQRPPPSHYHFASFTLMHFPPTHTTCTAHNHVRRGQDLGRAPNVLHQAGGGRAQQLRYVLLSCRQPRVARMPACLALAGSLISPLPSSSWLSF